MNQILATNNNKNDKDKNETVVEDNSFDTNEGYDFSSSNSYEGNNDYSNDYTSNY